MDNWIVRKKRENAAAGNDENNNEESNVVSVAKKKKYEIKFKREWASKYNWLQEDSTAKQGKRCMICGVPIYGNMFHIDRHANSDLHKKNANIAKATLKISSFTKPNSEEMELSRSAKAMEIRLCMFVAEHNLPFTALDHLAKCIKTVKDSRIISNLSINRHKGQNIIKSVTGPENCRQISEITKQQYYSVIIDESTDISMDKNLAVIIRVFTNKCRDRFLDFVQVSDSSSAGIFNALLKVLNDHDIPLSNLLGFTADNCGVMMGKRNGVQAKLKEICPKIFVIGDVCHNLNLSSEAAASVLPQEIEKLIRSINHHFCHSASRKIEFEKFQEDFGSAVHKILRFSSTRWLSRQIVVERILEQWSTLQYYFGLCNFEAGFGNESNKFIASTLSDSNIKLYFYFLSYVLKVINTVNIEMQAEESHIHVLYPRLTFLFNQICRNFIAKENICTNSIYSLNLANHIPIENIFCGTETELFYTDQNLTASEIFQFKNNILKFYIKFCDDLRKRIDFNNEILKLLPSIAPKEALSGNINSILPLILKLFPETELKQ
ncbi:uncharacterized protein LOC118756513, partial [Rhagoletis pomonella]|uniref:uncharacterized protein LOC118756513 n=1 Tax=Rhagoletis pomonella TaxID=28610 RepID=UPI00177D7572